MHFPPVFSESGLAVQRDFLTPNVASEQPSWNRHGQRDGVFNLGDVVAQSDAYQEQLHECYGYRIVNTAKDVDLLWLQQSVLTTRARRTMTDVRSRLLS